jgi:hypothetical protein
MDCSVITSPEEVPIQEISSMTNVSTVVAAHDDVLVSVQDSNVSAPAPAPAPAKHRKNVDFNSCELVDAILLSIHAKRLPCASTVTTVEDIREICQGWMESQIIPSCIRLNAFTDLPKYISDLASKSACISKRILAFTTLIVSNTPASGFKLTTDIECIYVSGKKNAHPKIHALNSGLDIKQQKGDIYIEYTTGEIVGWSCKQSSHATKSNYSVQKILGPAISRELKQTKTAFLTENGFPKFSKEQRDAVNQLFYPKNKNNAYWNAIRDAITHNKIAVLNELVKGLTGYTVPYPLYEFDGSSFQSLNAGDSNFHNDASSSSSSSGNVVVAATFEEHADYYKMKNGEERSAAKLFYQLCVAQKKYRVEIRWKGNVHSASPQFQIHDDAEDAPEDAATAEDAMMSENGLL